MGKESNARMLGIVISEPLRILGNYEPSTFDIYGDNVKPLEILEEDATGYTDKEQNCKGCMGPCGCCEDGNAPEPDPEEVPDQDWAAQKTEYEL